MARFRKLTLHKPCVMGRRTWTSLPPQFRPLPARENIVLSRIIVLPLDMGRVTTVDDILTECQEGQYVDKEVMVIGGAEIYMAFMPHASKIYLTQIQSELNGDKYFPVMPPEFEVTWAEHHDGFDFLELEKQ